MLLSNQIDSTELERFSAFEGLQNLFELQDNFSTNQPEENTQIDNLVPNSESVPNNPIRKKRGRPSLKSQAEVTKEPTKRGRKSKVVHEHEQKDHVSRPGRKSKVAGQVHQRSHEKVVENEQEEQEIANQVDVLQQHQEGVLRQKVQRSGRKSKALQQKEVLPSKLEEQKVKRSDRMSKVQPHQDQIENGTTRIDQASLSRKRRSASLINVTTNSKKAKVAKSDQLAEGRDLERQGNYISDQKYCLSLLFADTNKGKHYDAKLRGKNHCLNIS